MGRKPVGPAPMSAAERQRRRRHRQRYGITAVDIADIVTEIVGRYPHITMHQLLAELEERNRALTDKDRVKAIADRAEAMSKARQSWKM